MRLLTLFFFVLLSISTAKSQVDNSRLPNTVLWEISHPNTGTISYLFGTIHLIPENKFNISDSLRFCIQNVDKVFFEINMGETENMSNLPFLLSKMVMKNDTTISDLLTEEQSTRLFKKLNEKGFPQFVVEKIKPIFISILMESPSLTEKNPTDVIHKMKSYEIELNSLALNMNKEVFGLETIESQINLFDNIPYRLQAEMLLNDLDNKNIKDMDTEYKLFDIYHEQNINEMHTLMKADTLLKDFNDLLLDKRNIEWVNSILKLDHDKSYLFAVGAGHLPGKNGLIQLLKNKGYHLRPMENK